MARLYLFSFLVLCTAGRFCPAQSAPSGQRPVALRADAALVLVTLQATSPLGTSITNLMPVNFRVYEDGVEQVLKTFSRENVALSVGLVFDASGSMKNKVRETAAAAAAFFGTAGRDDEFFLVEFGDRPKLIVPFTTDSQQIYRKIASAKPFGRTSLIDAIRLALLQMKNARNPRKAIVILSDGGDNHSRTTARAIHSALLETDVQIYAMGLFDPEELPKHTQEEEKGPGLLAELTVQTGGRLYPIDNLNRLASISTTIGTELRNQYLLGYSPSNPARDGKYRRIKVDLSPPPDSPKLTTVYRHGYYAPTE
jgi:Ca-activated chloride channel homolog